MNLSCLFFDFIFSFSWSNVNLNAFFRERNLIERAFNLLWCHLLQFAWLFGNNWKMFNWNTLIRSNWSHVHFESNYRPRWIGVKFCLYLLVEISLWRILRYKTPFIRLGKTKNDFHSKILSLQMRERAKTPKTP